MTAYFTVLGRDRVTILSDTSCYDRDGIFCEEVSKVWRVPSWNGVIYCRGPVAANSIGLEVADRFGSFDEFVDKGADMIREIVDQTMHRNGDPLSGEMYLAGWSEREDRPRVYAMPLSQKSAAPGWPAFVWSAMKDENPFMILPVFWNDYPHLLHWLAAQRLVPMRDYQARDFVPEKHGPPMFEAIRQVKSRAGERSEKGDGGAGHHLVGGSLECTIITKSEIETSIIKHWPDVIGELIKPAPLAHFVGESSLRPGSGMSRQQRRALERQDRKAARAS